MAKPERVVTSLSAEGSGVLLNPENLRPADGLHALVQRLSRFAPWQDFSRLDSCLTESYRFERDDVLWAGQDPTDQLFVISEGFAFDFALLSGRKRHIFDFYGRGAICNWSRPARKDTPENLAFKARTEVCVLDRGRLADLLAQQNGIARAIDEYELSRAMRVSQRVRALISLPARDRLLILLLDLYDEFSATEDPRRWLPMPLTQEEIGDLIGTTSVHVSRTFSALEKDGEIERRGNAFLLKGVNGLRERMSYRRFGEPVLPHGLVDHSVAER